jgi:flagellar protein FliS
VAPLLPFVFETVNEIEKNGCGVMEQYIDTIENEVATLPAVEPVRNIPGHASAVYAYKREHSLNLTPVEIILRLYDVALVSCKKNDFMLARKAINELIASLNFDYREVSLGLFSLYDYSKRCIRENKIDEAVNTLQELRDTWAQAFNLHS